MFFFDTVNHVLDVQSGRITNLAYPQLGSDATCKAYVDNLVKGLRLKDAAHVASNANVDLTRAVTTLDGVTLVEGYRVLLLMQTNGVENGLYTVLGNNMLTRTNDLAAGSRAAGAFCFVQMGTMRGDKGYVCITDYPNDVVGVNSLTFSQFNGNIIAAGLGLFKDGNNVLNINLDPYSGMSFNGNYLRIDPSFAGNGLQLINGVLSVASINTVGTIMTGAWQGSVIQTPYGGTGNTTFATNGIVFSDGQKLVNSPSLSWDNSKKSLGINGIADPLSTGDGLTIFDRDATLQGSGKGIYFADNNAYKWGIRQSPVTPLSSIKSFPAQPWTAVNMSKNGNIVLLLAEPGSNSYISRNAGFNWELLINDGAQHVFSEAVMSFDGSVILICASEEYLYVSRDSGATFTLAVTDFPRIWEWCSISDNGQYMLASALADGMFASKDAGVTWTLVDNIPTDPVDLGFVHVSKDGSMQFAGYFGGALYASTDYGVTFTVRADVRNGNFYDIAEAQNANTMVLFEEPGSLFVSRNLGVTWTERLSDTPRHWVSVNVSADGSTIAAAELGGMIWFSKDFGATWTTLFNNLVANWNVVAVSDDDLGVIAAGSNVPVYLTRDAGATFAPITSGNVTVPMLSLSPSGYVYLPTYGGSVLRYLYAPSTILTISTGNNASKTALTDYLVFTDQKRLGIGYNSADSGQIANTLDVNGTLYVEDIVEFNVPLGVTSGGTGANSLPAGIVISNGTSAFTSTGPLTNGQIPIGTAKWNCGT